MLKYNVVARKNPQTKQLLYYAQLQPVTAVGLAALADAISKECTVTIHDIKAVLSALEEKVISYLQNGMSVRLGDLGSFRPTLNSRGSSTQEEFKPSNIRAVKVVFSKSSAMRYGFSLSNPTLQLMRVDEAGEETADDTEEAGA